ncbi:hypothetical protein [Mesorhizobium sp. M1322]|uniref:hypothetical protein n=1 Tax=Mesorhizobium sp. M1322 TaxID=2957081 RepID=UPI00333BCC71
MDKVAKMFSEAFPSAKYIRDASAHPADMLWNPFYEEQNSFDGPLSVGGVEVIRGEGIRSHFTGIVNRHVTVTIKGGVHSYELSQSSLEKLDEIRKAVFEVFKPASEASMQLFFAAMSSKDRPSA